MTILMDYLISWMIAAPIIGIVILVFVRDEESVRRVALGFTIVEFFLSLILWRGFDPTLKIMQFVERVEWMPTFNIQYAVGVDGISIVLVILTALLFPICILCSWTGITTRVRAYFSLILLVESTMIVVFTALDLFLFFMLWELAMIPMYFMIIIWGGANRIAAGF